MQESCNIFSLSCPRSSGIFWEVGEEGDWQNVEIVLGATFSCVFLADVFLGIVMPTPRFEHSLFQLTLYSEYPAWHYHKPIHGIHLESQVSPCCWSQGTDQGLPCDTPYPLKPHVHWPHTRPQSCSKGMYASSQWLPLGILGTPFYRMGLAWNITLHHRKSIRRKTSNKPFII